MSALEISIVSACDTKNAYGDEYSARVVGRAASKQRGVMLWVYKCHECAAWHLTKQAQGREYCVHAPKSVVADFVDLQGYNTVWEKLNDLPVNERAAELKTIVERINNEKKKASSHREHTLCELGRIVNQELRIADAVSERREWHDAVKACFGEEVLSRYQEAVAKYEHSKTLHVPCNTVEFFPDELSARDAGFTIVEEQNRDVWVYPCGQCQGWHLTEKKRAHHWHAETSYEDLDDYADLLQTTHFWNRLVDMPVLEAEALLRETNYRISQIHQLGAHGEQMRISNLLARLKSELKHLENRGNVLKNVFITEFGTNAFEVLKSWFERKKIDG